MPSQLSASTLKLTRLVKGHTKIATYTARQIHTSCNALATTEQDTYTGLLTSDEALVN